MDDADRHGARQLRRFDPARAARLDDPERFTYLPPPDLLALLDVPHGATLVDFGTGTGTYALAFARARRDVTVVALDEQPAMLALLEAKLATSDTPNVRPAGSAEIAGLRGGVERLLALNVLHELGDAALDDLRDLLTADGRALFVDWNADVERPVGPPRDHVYGVNEAVERLARHGLRVAGTRHFPYHYALVASPAAKAP